MRTSTTECLKGLHVLDIGPAEGLFSLAAISAGARRVSAINPPGQLTERFKRLIHFHQLQDRIEIKEGYFPHIAGVARRADLIFALGVIYHADNCESFVDALTTDRTPLWVEVMSSLDQGVSFDPINHQDSRNQFFSHVWLEGILEKRAYELVHCSAYNSRCLTDGYLHPNANGLWIRRAFVAFPTSSNTSDT